MTLWYVKEPVCIRSSLLETLPVDIAEQKKGSIQLVVWENVLLRTVLSYEANTTCFRSVERTSTKSILVSYIMINIEKFRRGKPTRYVQGKILRLMFSLATFKRSGAIQKQQRAAKIISVYENSESCFTSDSSESDFSKDSDIQKNVPILSIEKSSRGKHFGLNVLKKNSGSELFALRRPPYGNAYRDSRHIPKLLSKNSHNSTNCQNCRVVWWSYDPCRQCKCLLVHFKPYQVKVFSRQNIGPNFLPKTSALIFCPVTIFIF